MYTVFTKPDEARVDWYVVDAAGKTLGRLASQIAHRLKGKHKPDYAPHQDLGDHIVVINAGPSALRAPSSPISSTTSTPATWAT
jgi:large subunit ribosomal protein L13